MRDHAADYAEASYAVFPLRGKVPLIANAHPQGDPLNGTCKGECGRDGHGVLDATHDLSKVYQWWNRWPTANIGLRVPPNMLVLDIDPRNGGEHSLLELVRRHGPLPPTRTSCSGRGDGGRHLWWLHPGGKPTRSKLGKGLDIKTHSGYIVVPPSLHPETGKPYWWAVPAVDPVLPPDWLCKLLLPEPEKETSRRREHLSGPTIADSLSWAEILPRDWTCLDWDPDADGARWRHPHASAKWSATVKHNCLFVYSTNTGFPVTETGDPNGITKLKAYALLYHRGDCKAAYKALMDRRWWT